MLVLASFIIAIGGYFIVVSYCFLLVVTGLFYSAYIGFLASFSCDNRCYLLGC